MYNLKSLIEEFIRNQIPAGHIFDAHSIIGFLIEHHSDDYLNFHTSKEMTAQFHSRISKLIDSLCSNQDPVIARMPFDSFSRNIHNNYSANACWRKL